MDPVSVLLIILLLLLIIVGIALIVALVLAIKTILEIFALARTVKAEVATVGTILKAFSEGIGDKLSGAASLLGFLKKPVKKAVRKVKREA